MTLSLDLTVVKHEARGRDLHGCATGALIDQQDGTMIGKTTESVIQFHWMIALALRDREKTCFCAGARMDIDRAPIGDDKTLGAERFQPDVISAGRDRAFDAS